MLLIFYEDNNYKLNPKKPLILGRPGMNVLFFLCVTDFQMKL